jgi:hypothetical protein
MYTLPTIQLSKPNEKIKSLVEVQGLASKRLAVLLSVPSVSSQAHYLV